MMRSLGKLVKVIGILIIPLGLLMAFKEIYILEASVKDGILATVASLVGMIPEGLYLLTTLALLAGVLRLSKQKTLVKEVATIESLARADVLCVDKTGTITSEEMQVEELVRFVRRDITLTTSLLLYRSIWPHKKPITPLLKQ